MRHILKCEKHGYTMKGTCCSRKTTNPKPPKYSPEDPYGSYRRKVKREQLEKQGLL